MLRERTGVPGAWGRGPPPPGRPPPPPGHGPSPPPVSCALLPFPYKADAPALGALARSAGQRTFQLDVVVHLLAVPIQSDARVGRLRTGRVEARRLELHVIRLPLRRRLRRVLVGDLLTVQRRAIADLELR